MPEYEYRCKQCNQNFIVERSMSDPSAVRCQHCSGDDLARVWTASILSGKPSVAAATGSSAGAMCASNPVKPKGCCPCD